MSLVSFVDEADVPAVIRRIVASIRKERGRVVNARRAMAHHPDFLRVRGPFSNAIAKESALSNHIKEPAILKVSLINGCHR